jgi:hypothetical protein
MERKEVERGFETRVLEQTYTNERTTSGVSKRAQGQWMTWRRRRGGGSDWRMS